MSMGDLCDARALRDKAAAYANRVFAELASPYRFQADAYGRKNGDMENGEQRGGNLLLGGEVQGYAAKTKVNNAGAVGGLVTEDRVSIGSNHGYPLGFSRNGVQALFVKHGGKIGFGALER